MTLIGKQKRYLRALGHHLKANLTIGKNGVAEPVLDQLEVNLTAHELVKIKLLPSCLDDPDECAGVITRQTGAELVQHIGRTLLFYRPHPEQPVIRLPRSDGEALPAAHPKSL